MKRGMAMLVRVVFHHSIFANVVADVSNFSISVLKPSLSFVCPETVQVVLQFFFLVVPSYFSSILVVYLLGKVDAFTPILRIFSFVPIPPFVSLTFPRT